MTDRLNRLLDTLCDTSDLTDAEVRTELAEHGIDLEASQARFDAFLDGAFAQRAARGRPVTICTDEDGD